MKKAFVLVLFCWFASLATAQNKELLDSLQKALNSYAKEDTTKVKLLNEVATQKIYIEVNKTLHYRKIDTILFLSENALSLAEKLKYKKGVIASLKNIFKAYALTQNPKAVIYSEKLIKYFEESGDYREIGDTWDSFGFFSEDITLKIHYYKKSIEAYEKIKNKNNKDKSHIAFIICRIAQSYNRNKQHAEALNYYQRGLSLWKQEKYGEKNTPNYYLGEIAIFYDEAIQLSNLLGKKSLALEYEIGLLNMVDSIKNDKNKINLLYLVGSMYGNQNRAGIALEYLLKTVELQEKYHSKSISSTLVNISDIYTKQGYYEKAIQYLLKAKNLPEGMKYDYSDEYNIYNFLGFNFTKIGKYSEALDYHLRVKNELEKKIGGHIMDIINLAASLDGIGQAYMGEGKYQEALNSFFKAITISQQTQGFFENFINLHIAQCYQKMGNLRESLKYGLKVNQAEMSGTQTLTDAHLLISEVYAQLRQYSQAYQYHLKATAHKDSVNAIVEKNRIADFELQTVIKNNKQELEKLEVSRELQAEENKNQRLWIFSAFGAFLSAILLAFVLYRNSQNKQKANLLLQEKNEEITQQTQALQGKNRELEIEAALERVRSQSLAMHRSEELLGVITAVFQQLEQLDFNITTASLSLGYRENPFKYWMAVTGQPYPTEIDVPYADIAFMKFFQESATNNNGLITATFNKLQKDEWVHHIIEHTIVKYAPNERKKSMVDAPGITLSVATIKNIALAISNYSLVTYTNAENEILKRFARVFEQAYTRFLDLQKAEAQAREAQIEVALEKIRSRSLAMHYSSELREVIAVFFEKLNELKVLLGTVGITLFDNNSRDIIYWVGNSIQAPQLISVPYNEALMLDENFVRDGWVAMTEKKEYINKYYTRIQKDRFFEHLFSNNDLMQIPESAREILKGMESHIVCFLPYNNFGMFVDSWDGRVYEEEDLKVVKRAAKVFEQSYTRFLDLQKAEAQAREAQIEAALERVRSRTMAMQKSEELTEVVSTVFNQFKELGFALNDDGAAAILIFSDDSKNHTQWIADRWQSYAHPFKVDYTEHSLSSDIYNAKESGIDFFSKLYSVEEKNTYFEYLFNESEYFKQVPEEVKNMIFASENYGISVAFGKQHAAMLIPTNTGKLLEEDEKEILKRFVAVFEQTYTRFLDLQKAEAQAREAQIEAALERVRSRTMAMHNSSELIQTAELLFEQLKNLGAESQGVAFAICDINTTEVKKWTSIGLFSVPYTFEEGEYQMYEAWKNQVGIYERVYEGEGLQKYYELFMEIPEFKKGIQKFIEDGHPIPAWQKHHAITFKYGYLLLITLKPFIETEIFLRFAKVFEQTYTRFLDLQKAEAQARESQIEAALERVRSRTMAMQKSDELAEAANLMSNEVRGLGIPIWSCGYNIFEEDEKSCIGWMSTEGSIQPSFRIPLKVSQTFIKFYESRQNGEEFYEEKIGSRDLETHYNYMLTLDGFADILKGFLNAGHKLPTFQVNTVVNFAQGNLIFISAEPIPEAHEIFKRFAKVFEQTYTRFRDLQLKEHQAVELEEEKQKLKESYEELAQTNVALNYAFNQIEKKNEDITASINAALRIQSAMLPVPAHFENVFGKENYFVLFKPRDIVSGDFYFLEEVEDKIVLVCADCTGHGVPGAFMSMIGNQILTEIVGKEQITEPDQILNRLNKEINKVLKQNENQGREGMDIAVVTFTKNPQGFENLMGFGKVEYAGAMNPIYYVASDFPNQALSNSDLESQATLKEIKADKKPIGGIQEEDEKTFTKHEIQLSITNEQLSIKQQNSQQFNNLTIQQSTILYLCSDGFQDQFGGAQGKKFMVKRFRELLSSIHHLPMHEQRQVLDDTIEKWMAEGKEHQIDDILVVGIRV